MIHADVHVAGVAVRRADRERQQLELASRPTADLALAMRRCGLNEPRQVRVVVERDAVGREAQHLGQRLVEARHGLLRQAVDQIDVDRLEAARARRLDHVGGLLVALDRGSPPAARPGRNPARRAESRLKPSSAEQRDRRGIRAARIDLDRVLAVRRERRSDRGCIPISVAQLVMRLRKVGVPPPQCICSTRCPSPNSARLTSSISRSRYARYLRRPPAIARDDLVAGAVVADRAAERQVHVERQRPRGRRRCAVRSSARTVRRGIERLDEAVGGGVRGVARSGSVEAAQELADR